MTANGLKWKILMFFTRFCTQKNFPVPKHNAAAADNIHPNSTKNGFLAVAWREVRWQMFFSTDSNLFYITLTRKKGFGFGTFGLGQKHEELTVGGQNPGNWNRAVVASQQCQEGYFGWFLNIKSKIAPLKLKSEGLFWKKQDLNFSVRGG